MRWAEHRQHRDEGAASAMGFASSSRRFPWEPKTFIREMAIESKGNTTAGLPHHGKAGAIHQTEFAASGGQQRGHGKSMAGLVDPLKFQGRQDVILDGADRIESEPVLSEGATLNNDIVGGKHWHPGLEQFERKRQSKAIYELS